MPYIGNTIRAADDYRLIDDISSSFNGSTTSFALQVAGSAPVPFPKSPQQVLISVNGVIQEPDPTGASGFNLVGTNIVFSSAPTNGHAFFGIIYATADYLNAGGNFPAGSLGSPSITFIGDENTGLYRKGAGSIGFVADATEIANTDSNGLTISSGNLIIPDSVIHNGDTNTKIRFPAADTVTIETSGSERVRVDSSGKVGIGTASPDKEFHLERNDTSTSAIAKFKNAGTGDATLQIGTAATNFVIGMDNSDSDKFKLGYGSVLESMTGMTIDSSGNVGIGTTSPTCLLNVNTAASGSTTAIEITRTTHGTVGKFINSTGALEIQSNKQLVLSSDPAQGMTAAGSMIQFLVDGGEKARVDSGARLLIGNTTGSSMNAAADNLVVGSGTGHNGMTIFSAADGDGWVVFNDAANTTLTGAINYNHVNNNFAFYTNAAERMRIDSSGNVGIGTASPGGVLDIVASANDTRALLIRNTNNSGGSAHAKIEISGGDNATAILKLECNGQNHEIFEDGNGNLRIEDNDTERMRITSAGLIGIGTTTPNSIFEVNKNDSTAYDATADDGQRGVGATICANNGNGTANSFAQILFDNADSNQSVARIVAIRRSTSSTSLAFVTEHGNTKAERLRISSDGFIGTGGGTHATAPRAQFNINSEKNALTNANCNDPHHFTLCLRNDNDTNGEAIGIAFSASSTIDRVGAAIIHKRISAGSVGELRFYTCGVEGTTSLGGNLTKNREWRLGCNDEGNAAAVSTDQVHSFGDPGFDESAGSSNLARLVMQERSGSWISFRQGSAAHYGTISLSGSGVSYGSNSDYRLKDNVADLAGGITLLKQLRPVTFNWNDLSGLSKTETHQGFIAHEVQALIPDAVAGEKDGMDIYGNCTDSEGNITQEHVPESKKAEGETWVKVGENIKDQQLDTGKLIPILTQALKEAITEIETLKTKVAALEAA